MGRAVVSVYRRRKADNPEIVEVLRRNSEVLARTQDSIHTMFMARSRDGQQPIEIGYFYEELPLLGIGLVSLTTRARCRMANYLT